MSGATLPADRIIDGRDAFPVLTEGAKSAHEFVAWSNGPQLAIRKGQWKLVLNGVLHDGTPEGNKPFTGEDGGVPLRCKPGPLAKTQRPPSKPKRRRRTADVTPQLRREVENF